MKKRKALKPNMTGGEIKSIKVGPQWTFITIKIATDRITVAGAKRAFGTKLPGHKAVRRVKNREAQASI